MLVNSGTYLPAIEQLTWKPQRHPGHLDFDFFPPRKSGKYLSCLATVKSAMESTLDAAWPNHWNQRMPPRNHIGTWSLWIKDPSGTIRACWDSLWASHTNHTCWKMVRPSHVDSNSSPVLNMKVQACNSSAHKAAAGELKVQSSRSFLATYLVLSRVGLHETKSHGNSSSGKGACCQNCLSLISRTHIIKGAN